MHRIANSLDISLENLLGYVKQLESNVQSLNEEIEEKKSEKKYALEDYDVTLEDLEEYKASEPLFKSFA
ncbi:MAG: hypothetical protein JO297_18490 [Nitrososphaeraceae archaeon]|nr:hypothetical protein [Nitrososphaeraceae archaeon]